MRLYAGDCLEVLPGLAAESIDSVVTDPPYGLKFMGKDWDHGIPGVHFWKEILRVAKPGCHLLAFGGTRTFHRLMVAIEDAGWEIRDTLMWVYGSGFPKSHNLNGDHKGWGTALKPAWEPIIMARKPLIGTVAENVMKFGTGAINVDGCRVGYVNQSDKEAALSGDAFKRKDTSDKGWSRPWMEDKERVERMNRESKERAQAGRWPANLVHDGSEEVLELFPVTGNNARKRKGGGIQNRYVGGKVERAMNPSNAYHSDSGSAARFFYCAKASKSDRDEGCEGLDKKLYARSGGAQGAELRGEIEYKQDSIGLNRISLVRNNHPTVKPTTLMRYLCKLVTPLGGIVLDPFMGSGSTGKGAKLEGFEFIGIDSNPEYVEIAKARIGYNDQH